MPWSSKSISFKHLNNKSPKYIERAKDNVMSWSRIFAGALANTELLNDYGIVGPLEEDKLVLLREERLDIII